MIVYGLIDRRTFQRGLGEFPVASLYCPALPLLQNEGDVWEFLVRSVVLAPINHVDRDLRELEVSARTNASVSQLSSHV